MLPYLIFGVTFAFAAAVQPGPLQTYLASETVAHGWRRTLPAALSPLLSDGPVIALVLIVLSRLPARWVPALRCAGAAFLFYLAWQAYVAWRDYQAVGSPDPGFARRSVVRAAFVNMLNPNPYLAWSLVLGPLFLKGWRETPAHGVGLLVAFYSTMVVSLAAIITLFALARRLGPRIARTLVAASAVALACFGGYQLWAGVGALLG